MKPRSKSLTDEHRPIVRQMYEEGASPAIILAWCHQHDYSYTWGSIVHMASVSQPDNWVRGCRIPAAAVSRWDKAPRIDEDAVIFADCHIPYHDAVFMGKVAEVAIAWGVKRAIMDADAIDLDWLSRFERAGSRAKQEIKAYQDVTDALLEWFPGGIDIHMANHGERIRRLVANLSLEAQELLSVTTKADDPAQSLYIHRPEMRMTDYSYVFVHGVRICHPSATGKETGAYISEAHECDVVVEHTHFRSITWSRSDRYVAVETGGCFDPKKLKYISARQTARPRGRQRQGAAIIIKGLDDKPHIYHLWPRTDWAAMKRLYPAERPVPNGRPN